MDSDTENEFEPIEKHSPSSPLTIATLFYLVTLSGIVSACLRSLVGHENVTVPSLVGALVFCIAIGFLGGGLLGRLYFRVVKASLVGSFVGILVGTVAAGLVLVQSDYFFEIVFVAFGGCWLLVFMMMLSVRLQGAR